MSKSETQLDAIARIMGHESKDTRKLMPFGKYLGVPLGDVPLKYLKWIVKQDIDDKLLEDIENEIGDRK